MSYWIRNLYGVFWGKYFSNKVPFNQEYIWNSRARIADIDMLGHINHADYFRLCEYARWTWASAGGMIDYWKKLSCGPVITLAAARYRRSIPLFTKYCIKSNVIHVTERAFYMTQKFYVKDQLACSVLLELRIVGKKGTYNAIEQFKDLVPDGKIPNADLDPNIKQSLDVFHALEAYLLEKELPELILSPHPSATPTRKEA